MVEIKRRSPVKFGAPVKNTESRGDWTVALEYSEEGNGPWIVDLSHKARWDLQSREIGGMTPRDAAMPEKPGQCALENNVLVNRLNATQASIWHLGAETPALPDFTGYTDVTEATAFLALFGPNTFRIAEKLTSLDFLDPGRKTPFLFQGPFCHVPCQIVAMEKETDGAGGILLTCSRGYADSMVHAVLDSGAEFGLAPAGEARFSEWLTGLEDRSGV